MTLTQCAAILQGSHGTTVCVIHDQTTLQIAESTFVILSCIALVAAALNKMITNSAVNRYGNNGRIELYKSFPILGRVIYLTIHVLERYS